MRDSSHIRTTNIVIYTKIVLVPYYLASRARS